MKKRKLSFTSVGGSSILTIFAVLWFFGICAFVTVDGKSKL